MNETAAEIDQQFPFTVEDWDALRSYYHDSVMAETTLCGLANNLGLKWPIGGKDETPGKYIKFTLEELADLPEFFGKGNRLPLFYSILLETKQLEDPFAEMIQHFDDLPKEELEPSPSFLEELEVPSEYPVELMNFTKRTRGICKEGGNETVSELIEFLQNNKNALIMNEEFGRFFSHIIHMDKSRLRQFLPIRKESKGIFLAEAIGNIGRRLKDIEASTLVHAYSVTTTKAEWSEKSILPKADALILIEEMKQTLGKCFELMPDQAQELRCAIDSGISSSVRYFVSLNDPDQEGLAIAVAKAALDVKPRFKGFIGNLLT